jgi:hypothetical protein
VVLLLSGSQLRLQGRLALLPLCGGRGQLLLSTCQLLLRLGQQTLQVTCMLVCLLLLLLQRVPLSLHCRKLHGNNGSKRATLGWQHTAC